MKKVSVFLLLLLSLPAISNAQNNFRIGLNAGRLKPIDYSGGFGLNAELTCCISEHIDLTCACSKARLSWIHILTQF